MAVVLIVCVSSYKDGFRLLLALFMHERLVSINSYHRRTIYLVRAENPASGLAIGT